MKYIQITCIECIHKYFFEHQYQDFLSKVYKSIFSQVLIIIYLIIQGIYIGQSFIKCYLDILYTFLLKVLF